METYQVVKFVKLYDHAVVPSYSHPGDAGMDLYALDHTYLEPDSWATVGTGIALELPRGFVGLVCPRSGMAARYAVTVLNGPGVVDAGYRGEVKVILSNHGPTTYEIHSGDRIAQLVLTPFRAAMLQEVQELENTSRGSGGHGSTGR